MRHIDCEFEAEVLAAAVESRWPDGADAQLRAHVAACPICSEAALAAGAISKARDEMRGSFVVPDSGRVWWLAQLRARREAIEAAGRPITVAHLVAFACAAGLCGACFGATSTWFQDALRWVASSPIAALLAQHVALAAGAGAILLLIPAAAYFALGKE